MNPSLPTAIGGSTEAAMAELVEWIGGHVESEPLARACLFEAGRHFERFTGGSLAELADEFCDLPPSVRHGLIRLAAYRYREIIACQDAPPAAVAALWRPWRRMRQS